MRWDAETERLWAEWVKDRPSGVRVLCERFKADRLYWLDPPGQVVTIYSYCEDGTLTVIVDAERNHGRVLFSRRVFGIKPEDLHAYDGATE